MSHSPVDSPGAATDEPAPIPPPSVPTPGEPPTLTESLPESLIQSAAACGADIRGDRGTRADGWTPDRIRTFLNILSLRGHVGEAAEAVGMSPQSAYALRNSDKALAFQIAWQGALMVSRHRLEGELMARAMGGQVEVTVKENGKRVERHRIDNRLGLALLRRFDRFVESDKRFVSRLVVQDFENFVEIAANNDEEAALRFIGDHEDPFRWGFRCQVKPSLGWDAVSQAICRAGYDTPPLPNAINPSVRPASPDQPA